MWAILQGEGELTRCLMDAGHRPHILFKANHLLLKLQELSAPEVREAMALFPTEIRESLSAITEQPLGATKAIANDFAKAAVKEVMERNQMHAAGFAFVKILGLPLFKRDIVYRELFPLQEVDRIVTALDEPMADEIIADLARRPPPGSFHVLRRLLYRHGYI
jgi:hypothetical protein